jgi:hypothetical protein
VGGRNKRVIFQWQTEVGETEAMEVSGGPHKNTHREAETPREWREAKQVAATGLT